MTPIQVFDALNGKSFTYLECEDGSKFGGTPLTVNFCADEGLEPACLEVTPEGVVLHFNTREAGSMHGVSVWLADIVAVG
jgi:hypothetical protein